VSAWSDYFGALQFIEKAVTHSDHATAKDRLYIEAWNHSLHARPEEAAQDYLEIIERYPDEKEAYRRLASVYRINEAVRDVPRSIELFEKAIELDPLYAEAYNGLAYSCDYIGNYEKSIWAINKYIELEPDEPNPYDSRGELYANSGQPELSLQSFLKAIQLDSNFVSAYRGAVAMTMFLRRYEQADQLSRPLLSHASPDLRSNSRRWRVRLAVHQGAFSEALRRGREAVQRDREDFGDSMNLMFSSGTLSNVYAHLGNLDAMREYASQMQAISEAMDPTGFANMLTLSLVAVWEARAGQIERSDSLLAALKSLEVSDPVRDSQSYFATVAENAFAKEDYARALENFIRSASDHRDFYDQYWLGRGYAGAGRLRDAVNTFESARDTYDQSRWEAPFESVLLRYHLGVAYEKSGRADKAIEQYQKFLDIWKDADTELDELKDARQRLAALQS